MTKQRKLIYQIVKDSMSHLSAEEIFFRAKQVMPSISMGTVYRNLGLMVEDKELRKIRRRILRDLKKEKVINPKALYYLRKYVDASFNKKTVNIEGRYIEKQNTLEQLYATGRAEVYESIAEYYDI
jgi:hypothetical protein